MKQQENGQTQVDGMAKYTAWSTVFQWLIVPTILGGAIYTQEWEFMFVALAIFIIAEIFQMRSYIRMIEAFRHVVETPPKQRRLSELLKTKS